MADKIERREFLKYLLTSGIVLTGTGGISSLLSGCEKQREVSVQRIYDFLDHLNEAEIVTPSKEFVKRSSFIIGREKKEILFEHPDSSITFKNVAIQKNASLSFGIGINEPAWNKEGDGVLFEIVITDKKSNKHPLYSRYIDPKKNPDDRKWFDESIDLKSFEGEKVSFTFKTSSGPKGNKVCDWAGWGDPQVNHTKSIKVKVKEPDHINIILIVVDTLRADHLGCYGNINIKTPQIDRMASEGVLFENHFSQCSTTNPSHASIFTSLYLKNHGVYDNKTRLSNSVITIAEILKSHNYKTVAAVSAFHMNSEYSGFGQGFDDYYDVKPPPDHKSNEFIFLTRRADKTNEKIFSWLERNYQKKFFMWLHYFDPHAPYAPPKPYNTMYYDGDPADPDNHSMDRVIYSNFQPHPPEWLKNITDIEYVKAQYKGEVTYTDNAIGNVLNCLKEFRLENNTLVILTSDHGESLGEHAMYFDHSGLHKEVLHVPFIMKCPQLLPSEKRVKSLNMSIDIVPTVLDLLNINFETSNFDGEILSPVINDKHPLKKERYIYSENMKKVAVSVRSNQWAAIKDLQTLDYSSQYQFIKDRIKLYDRENDPQELIDIARNHPEIAGRFDPQLIAWLKDTKSIARSTKKPKVNKELQEKLRALGYAQ